MYKENLFPPLTTPQTNRIYFVPNKLPDSVVPIWQYPASCDHMRCIHNIIILYYDVRIDQLTTDA